MFIKFINVTTPWQRDVELRRYRTQGPRVSIFKTDVEDGAKDGQQKIRADRANL